MANIYWTALALLVVSTGSICMVTCGRILAFVPFPSKSHQRIIQPLLKQLALRGHEVLCYSPHPLENAPENYRAVKIPDYMAKYKETIGAEDGKESQAYSQTTGITFLYNNIFFKSFGLQFTHWTYNLKEVKDLIKSDLEFDAVIMETTFYQESFVGLAHRFGAPVIEYLPAANLHWSYWLQGNPFDTSYIVDSMLPYSDHMTFSERLTNTFLSGCIRLIWYHHFMPKYQKIMDENLRYEGWERRPSMVDMISNTSLVLVNTHFSLNYPFPMAPNYKEVGGLNLVEPKPLPNDLQTFMDEAEDGVIYFTLGSTIDVSGMLQDDLRVIFAKVFSELKQRVLWKWEKAFPNKPSNVKISKWFPQQDILGHKNMKLFITHGGVLSITEALYHGLPTIGIPIVGDQHKNVEMMRVNGYALPLYLDNLTYASLKWTIREILDKPQYAESAKMRSSLLRDKSETALETAVFWTEYVMRHQGAHHLRPAVATMPWYQQAMLDVYFVSLLIVVLPFYVSCKLSHKFVKIILKLGSVLKKALTT